MFLPSSFLHRKHSHFLNSSSSVLLPAKTGIFIVNQFFKSIYCFCIWKLSCNSTDSLMRTMSLVCRSSYEEPAWNTSLVKTGGSCELNLDEHTSACQIFYWTCLITLTLLSPWLIQFSQAIHLPSPWLQNANMQFKWHYSEML